MVDLLLILVVLAAAAVFVSAPLRRRPAEAPAAIDPPAEETTSELGELEAARDAKLRELRDAELDHRTGKLSDADYAAVDGALRAEAIEILRALDEAREHISAQDAQDPESADTITD